MLVVPGSGILPADPREVREAREEGIEILPLVAPVEFLGNGRVTGVRCVRMELKGFDDFKVPSTPPSSGLAKKES